MSERAASRAHGWKRVLPAILLLIGSIGPAVGQAAGTPDDVEGLVAWYRGQSLHKQMRDGDPVRSWADSSGNGHDLSEVTGGLPSIFRTKRVNDRPVVEIGKQTAFSVADPFELNDHTIFLVYAASGPMRALFSSDTDDRSGIILRDEGRFDQVQAGMGKSRYSQAAIEPGEYRLTVLTGEGGQLDAYINGEPSAAGGQFPGTLRVGRFFRLRLSTAVINDGAGLSIAEMIFFNRRLDSDERRSVEEHLAGLYGMELEDPPAPPPKPVRWRPDRALVHIETSTGENLNDDTVVIEWDKAVRLEGAFRQDPEHPSRLYATEDQRVRIGVDLALTAAAPGIRVRVAILKNRETYVEQEGQTGRAAEKGQRLEAWFDAPLLMYADDYFEIVTMRDGAEGQAVSVPGDTKLLVRKGHRAKPRRGAGH